MTSTLIEHNPLLKRPLLTLLSLSERYPEHDRTELEDRAAQEQGGSFTRQTPTTIIDILLRNEALRETVYVDGVAYEGKAHDLQTDLEVDEDAVITRSITLTETGKELLDEYTGDTQLRALFRKKPEHVEVYIAMLERCVNEGCGRSDLEQVIDALPALQPDRYTGEKKIYPQYFIDSLETAGGISWQGSWHTTAEGRMVIEGVN